MRNVGADDRHHRQARVEQQQDRDADRAGADRGNRDEHAKHRARHHGQGRSRLVGDMLQPLAIALHDRLAEDQRGGGEQERKAQHQIDDGALRGGIEVELPHHQQRHHARGQAAAGEPDHGRPVNAAPQAMHQAAAGLGGRGIEQVGADRRGRVNAEQQDEQRRHQRATADTGHSDKQADAESGRDVKRIDHLHAFC